MSKIAVNEDYGGNRLRKAIDYFCHLAVAPEHCARIEKADPAFAQSEFWPKMRWLKEVNDDLHDPTYTDMLRVAFTSEFGRGKLQDLVALLSGRNFGAREYEESIAEASFDKLKQGVLAFIVVSAVQPRLESRRGQSAQPGWAKDRLSLARGAYAHQPDRYSRELRTGGRNPR